MAVATRFDSRRRAGPRPPPQGHPASRRPHGHIHDDDSGNI